MNCHKCGNIVQPGTAFCPFCNEALNTGYAQQNYPQGYGGYPQGNAQPQNNYPQGNLQQGGYDQFGNPLQQTGGFPAQGNLAQQQQQQLQQQNQQVYQQSYVQYGQQQNYPTGFQTPYVYGQQTGQHENKLLNAITELPRTFLDSFTKPSEVLRNIIERKDLITSTIVIALALILSLLAGMLIMRGFVSVMFTLSSVIKGGNIAGNSASVNQGINYIARQFGLPIGGIVALCQLLSMLLPSLVAMVYVCVVCKVRFSWELFLGFCGITTMPTIAATVLAMLLSLLSPWLSVLACICGMVISYLQMGMMMTQVTGKTETQMLPVKMICICVSILLVLLFNGVVGGILMSGTVTRILTYL